MILTAWRTGADGSQLYVVNDRNTLIWVCEQTPDPVRLANEQRRLNEYTKDKVTDEELSRFKPPSGEKDANRQGANKENKENVANRIKENSEVLAENDQCVLAKVMKVDIDRRLVLLEASEKLRGEVPMLNVSDPDPGTQVRAFGFPYAAEYSTRRATEREKSRLRLVPTITSGTVVKTVTDAKDGQMIVHQVPVSDGAWGGPLVNNCNQVVGLNTQTKSEKLVKFDAEVKPKKKNSGQIEPSTIIVPTSNVSAALGARELKTFLELNGYSLFAKSALCTATLAGAFSLQQNMWPLFVGATALLLASAAMVVAIRRPGPVRDTVIRMFPGRGRSRKSTTVQQGYRDGYSGRSSHGPSDYMSDAAVTDAYAARPARASFARTLPT